MKNLAGSCPRENRNQNTIASQEEAHIYVGIQKTPTYTLESVGHPIPALNADRLFANCTFIAFEDEKMDDC